MDASIDTTAIETPIPLALERTVPADTPATLSSHDAAAVLRKLRQKINDTTDSTRATSVLGSSPGMHRARSKAAACRSGGRRAEAFELFGGFVLTAEKIASCRARADRSALVLRSVAKARRAAR
jgi:hypothetical protein